MPTTAKITKRSTMQEVLEAYPSAQRALFRKYHIGGRIYAQKGMVLRAIQEFEAALEIHAGEPSCEER